MNEALFKELFEHASGITAEGGAFVVAESQKLTVYLSGGARAVEVGQVVRVELRGAILKLTRSEAHGEFLCPLAQLLAIAIAPDGPGSGVRTGFE